jgi:basic membrane protein A
MLPGTVDDVGWNLSMHNAAAQVAEELDVEVSESSNTFDPTASEPVLRQFLEGSYNLIVVHGFNFEPVLNEVAPENADQLFTMASFGDPQFPNTSMYTWSYLESGYSMCWLGARLSETGTIGMVGAADVPFNVELHEGCRLGAEAAVPGTEVLEAYANDFFDQQKAFEQAQAVVDGGADVIFVSGGVDSSIGALSYCEDNDLICMGVNVDQSQVAPNSVVSSAMTDWTPFLHEWIDQAATGDFQSAVYNATFGNGGLAVPPFDGPSAEKVPVEIQEEFTVMIEQLASEEITLPASEAHPGYR